MAEIKRRRLAIPSHFPSSAAYVCRCLRSTFEGPGGPFGNVAPPCEWVPASLLSVPVSPQGPERWRGAGDVVLLALPDLALALRSQPDSTGPRVWFIHFRHRQPSIPPPPPPEKFRSSGPSSLWNAGRLETPRTTNAPLARVQFSAIRHAACHACATVARQVVPGGAGLKLDSPLPGG